MKIRKHQIHFFIILFTISILSITGMYAYALFDVTSVGKIENGGERLLDGVRGVATTTIDGSTYVVAASQNEDGIEIIDISDPTSPTSVGRLAHSTNLNGAHQVDITTIGSSTYAVVAAKSNHSIEIIDISDPTSPTSVGRLVDDGNTEMAGAYDIAIATIGDKTYAVVTGNSDHGVEIIDISNPTNCCQVGVAGVTDDNDRLLKNPTEVRIATIGGSTYAVVGSHVDDGVEIIDISTPTSPSPVGRISDTDDGNSGATYELEATNSLAIATIGSSTYVVAGGYDDDGIAIIDISTPASPVYVSELEDDSNKGGCTAVQVCLDGPRGIAVETIGGYTYAIVVSHRDSGVTIIDITTPSDPTIVATVYDDNDNELLGAKDVTIATIGDSIYAVVAGWNDDGIEIIHLYTGSTITITSSSGSSGDTVGFDTISYTVTLGSTANDFTIEDITVTGTANSGSPEASNFSGSGTTYTFDVIRGSSDGTVLVSVAAQLGTASDTYTLTFDTSTTSSTCARLVILGNCGTIAINNDEYQIINTWTNVPTTEVLVGQPVSITLSTPHNYAAGKINSASVYTEIFGSAANYELGSHLDYSIMKSDYYVSEPELFQVSGATHRITQDTDVKNLKLFEIVFTMVFAKPMDTSHIVVETKNMHGIPETIYLGNALRVIESPVQLLTMEEKSKFSIVDPEPEMDPEPEQTKKEKSKRQRR